HVCAAGERVVRAMVLRCWHTRGLALRAMFCAHAGEHARPGAALLCLLPDLVRPARRGWFDQYQAPALPAGLALSADGCSHHTKRCAASAASARVVAGDCLCCRMVWHFSEALLREHTLYRRLERRSGRSGGEPCRRRAARL